MLQVLQELAGDDATRGELLVWLAIVGAGMGSGAWVGFEVSRAIWKVGVGAAKALLVK